MKRFFTIIGSAAILISLPIVAAAYSDITEDHQNYVAITWLSEQQILQGYEDGTFKPEQLVNRAESLKVIFVGRNIEIPEDAQGLNFSDVDNSAWYAPYISIAKELGIVEGNPDGTFAPDRDVIRAEFVKILLLSNEFKKEKWQGMEIFADVPKTEWYSPFMNYAGQSGLITKDSLNKLYPGRALTRGEVAEILYIMAVIRMAQDTQMLITQAEAQMSQIDIYIGKNDPITAKRASELAVDMTQQAYANLPDDLTVVGSAKLARAYDFVVSAFISAIEKDYSSSADWANQAISKADEAIQVDPQTEPTATHIKNRANEILTQLTTTP